MPIPTVDPATGLLPAPGPYLASLQEIEQVFVTGAPNPAHRAAIFTALLSWIHVARRTFGAGRLLVNGGFVTHKASEPHDLDLVFIPDDPNVVIQALVGGDGYDLLTLQDVFFVHPDPGGSLQRLQPFGGLIDGFVADPRSSQQLEYWHSLWSAVKGTNGQMVAGAAKGYLEVLI